MAPRGVSRIKYESIWQSVLDPVMMRFDPQLTALRCAVLACIAAGAAVVFPAAAQGVDRVEQQDRDRTRRADIRASINDFVRIQSDSERARSSLSDEERLEMRRQIDEAIRKAYGRRSAN